MLRLDIGERLAVLALDRDNALRLEPRRPVDHSDLVLLEKEGDAGRKLARHLPRAADHLGEIERHAVRLEAKLFRVPDKRRHLSGTKERLRRNAAPVQADAAQMLALDDDRLQTKLRSADRRDIAAGAAADYRDIECFRHNKPSPQYLIALSKNVTVAASPSMERTA